MLTHEELVKKLRRRRSVQVEYDELREEFALLDEMLKARQRKGMTQAEVAQKMGTTTPTVVRLEGRGNRKRSPTVASLRKYAKAVGCRLEIRLQPDEKRPTAAK